MWHCKLQIVCSGTHTSMADTQWPMKNLEWASRWNNLFYSPIIRISAVLRQDFSAFFRVRQSFHAEGTQNKRLCNNPFLFLNLDGYLLLLAWKNVLRKWQSHLLSSVIVYIRTLNGKIMINHSYCRF